MIEQTVSQWHQHLRGDLPGGLDELLHDDVVFYSPIVYTPQEGKAVTKLYLQAAGQTLPGEKSDQSAERGHEALPRGGGTDPARDRHERRQQQRGSVSLHQAGDVR